MNNQRKLLNYRRKYHNGTFRKFVLFLNVCKIRNTIAILKQFLILQVSNWFRISTCGYFRYSVTLIQEHTDKNCSASSFFFDEMKNNCKETHVNKNHWSN